MPAFNPTITRYAGGLAAGLADLGRGVGDRMNYSRKKADEEALDQREHRQQKELQSGRDASDMQQMAVQYGQRAALQEQEGKQREALQRAGWERADKQEETSDAERVGFYEGKWQRLSQEIPVSEKEQEKFLAGNKGTKQAMVEGLEMAYARKQKQREEEEALKRQSGPLEAQPLRDAEGNLVGTQIIQKRPGGDKPYGWMPKQQPTTAPLNPPAGMVPKSFNSKTGTTIYGQPTDGTLNVLEEAPPKSRTRRGVVDELFP